MYIVLIHWKPSEAEPFRALLIEAGYSVELMGPENMQDLRRITADADAVLIDLGRLPMQGCAVAVQLRRRAATREVPLVFVGGAEEKVLAVRKQLPDAGFIEWAGIPLELERAIRRTPKRPVVPETMSGYSANPLWKKLGIKAGSAVGLIGAPEGFEQLLDPLPEAVRVSSKVAGADRVLVFVQSMKELDRTGGKALTSAAAGATVWIAWPKKASGIVSDVSETSIRAWAIARGWVDYKVCAIDATWSGFALARRKG